MPAVPSKWNTNNRDWLLNAKKGIAFELPALKKVGIWQGIAQPMLVVRCDAGRIQTFVYTASAIQMEAADENHTVRVSFDGEPEAIERWADSPEHDALFALTPWHLPSASRPPRHSRSATRPTTPRAP